MENPEPDIFAQLEALIGPDPEGDARARTETADLWTRAAQFVANRARRWAACPHRACRHAKSCAGKGPPETPLPCGSVADDTRIGEFVTFAALEHIRQMFGQLGIPISGTAFSQRSGDGD